MDAVISTTSEFIENRTYDEVAVGDQASLSKTISQQDIDLFAVVSGDVNPAHMDPAYARTDMFHRIIAHGMLSAGLISSVLGTRLPGPGTIYLGQDLRFLRPVDIGDTITASVIVKEKHPEKGDLVLECRCVNQSGEVVVTGTAHVRAPTEKVRRPRIELPSVRLSRHERFHAVIGEATAGSGPPVPTAIAHPCDPESVGAAVEAASAGLIEPILVGPKATILAAANTAKLDISAFRLVDTAPHEAAAAAVGLVRKGEAALLMKGSLHTDELLHAVLEPGSGLSIGRRLSHVYLIDVPGYPRPLLITDAAVNIAPDLDQKRDIVQNAIDLAHVMGIQLPRVALLSAVETVNPKIRSTLDAAALCKMADRGQITGALVDGPLAFDNAISPAAAKEKGIVSEVAGRADILVVPDLEAGNMLAKQLTFLAGADAAGVVLGARIPIILTSRADAERTRLASCAVAVLIARNRAAAAQKAAGV
ncbi:bifunctional enoyl-CoA hydratase/phosphate acetyltransferase [Bradyrhizobium sp. dw_78]|uniref:bifunctional enoyl-CoA hydratase/phosphate acetyltransferase n=1 Tax=Bradyrhizobium sp. dw_78 TaxID=2719793 RepID=UPI001BD32D54|nr:bifunctional enoyl-CoA hydratase/phosphate acetyltransferase [Bradyrhizobium sp. dw_78]